MKIRFPLQIAFILSIVVLICCAHSPQAKKQGMTIKIEIVKGETTDTSVLRLLGVPGSIATDNIGNEVWSYHNLSFSTTKTTEKNSLIFWEISTGVENQTPEPFDFKITFDQNDIVKNYEIIQKSF